jgi:ribokinase
MSKRIVIVGSINLDLVAVTGRIPRAGETVAGSAFQTFPGGKGANQAVAAARLGASVTMIGKVGSDNFGAELRESLEDAGVDISTVSRVSGSSGVALITTDTKGENAITVVAGANHTLTPSDVESQISVIRKAGVVLTQLEIPLDTVECLSKIASREDIPLILDPAPARLLPSALLNNVSWLTPNETETCLLLGQPDYQVSQRDLPQLADAILKLGSRNVILKLGNRGSYLAMSDGCSELIPAYDVNAVDTTAAGDAFNGAFAVGLVEGKSPAESARFASAVAAISVTRSGAQPSMPTRNDVEQFLHKNLVMDANELQTSYPN